MAFVIGKAPGGGGDRFHTDFLAEIQQNLRENDSKYYMNSQAKRPDKMPEQIWCRNKRPCHFVGRKRPEMGLYQRIAKIKQATNRV